MVEIPGCDEGALEDWKRAKLSRGKGLVAGFEEIRNNESATFLARTILASRETWYAESQASKHPPMDGAFRMELAMRAA